MTLLKDIEENKSVTECEDKHQASKTAGYKSFKTTMDNYNMLGNKVVSFTKKVMFKAFFKNRDLF